MAADILSDVFALVRLTGALMFRLDVQGHWCVANSMTEASTMARLLPPGTDQIIVFHVVSQGECWMRQPPGDWVHTRTGDAVVLAHGAAHQIGNRPEASPVPFRDVLGGRSFTELRDLSFDVGPGPRVQLVCGFLGCSKRAFAPLCNALPEFCKVTLGGRARELVGYALSEALDDRPGANTLRVRMAELLFMETLRLYMQALPADATGWLAGLRDPLVGHALELLHKDPGKPWSVDVLASQTNASRSCLAGRFRDVIGEPPMRYLTQLRMQMASRYLAQRSCSIERIAGEVGYDSSAAFQRAFKRHFGTPPATWRRNVRAAADAQAS